MSGKHEVLLDFIEKREIDIAVIQETKFNAKSKMKPTPNYNLVKENRQNKDGGGVAILIKKDIPFQKVKTPNSLVDNHLEEITISINNDRGSSLFIRNVYIPPASSCSPGYIPPVDQLSAGLGDTYLILGDVNAHHTLWYSEDNVDNRGQQFAEWIGETDLGILNEDTPTRVTENSSTSPDLSLASSNCLPTCSWTTEYALGSDHLPMIIAMSKDIKRIKTENKTFINFAKADWTGFKAETEEMFAKATISNDVHKSEKTFRQIITTAAKHNIPCGRIPNVLNGIPSATARLVEERDNLRKEDPVTNSDRVKDLTREINISIKEHRQKKWIKHLDSCGAGTKKLWDTIKNLNTGPKQQQNQSIKFNNVHINNSKKLAEEFNRQYTPDATDKSTKPFRNLLRNLRKKSEDPEIEITEDQVRKAIKKSKNSKALGPDNISPVMLKHIGPLGITFLTNIYNCCVNQAIIPTIWKTARIIPLLKPNKPADEGSSHRPISLLSPPAKTLEAIILQPLQDALPLANHQHGFRKGRSTTTALQDIVTYIKSNLNRKKPAFRTVMVAVDLSRAFDTVNHEILISDIAKLEINSRYKRFLASYLRGRYTYVEFRGERSNTRKMRQGVPQGGVLSPPLFNLYMSTMPTPPSTSHLTTYADDGTVCGSGPKIEPICQQLNTYLDKLNNWFLQRNLFISPSKSSATIFTTWSNEVGIELPIFIDGKKVPTIKNPTILGVTLDPTLSFKSHLTKIKSKVNSRTNILKALSGTTWGKDKEILVSTYKAVGQSVLNYCAPVWTPSLSKASWDELQPCQNAALRAALGCVKMTSTDHLHSESKIMPVKDHNEMLSRQFLLSTQKPNHPNRLDLNHRPDRIMKPTLTTMYAESIKHLVPDGGLDEESYKAGLKRLHTECVSMTINNQAYNNIINAPAPRICPTEEYLPRQTRTTLSQLRSGYSTHLKSYMHRIRPDLYQDVCPDCNRGPHDTAHLFTCPAKPTDLDPWSLWEDPARAAIFLGLRTGGEMDELNDND